LVAARKYNYELLAQNAGCLQLTPNFIGKRFKNPVSGSPVEANKRK
jgi:hypothetical protein